MYSIPKLITCLAATGLGLSVLGGCATQSRQTPVAVNTQAIGPDAAMVYRNWAQSSAYFPSGAVEAGSTRFAFRPSTDLPPRVQQLLEAPLFVGNTLLAPFTYFIEPPLATITYRGAAVPPSYNANPPLPAPAR